MTEVDEEDEATSLSEEFASSAASLKEGFALSASEVRGLLQAVRSCRMRLETAEASEAPGSSLNGPAEPRKAAVAELNAEFEQRETVTKLRNMHKAMHGALSKLGKTVDAFVPPEDLEVFRNAAKKDQELESKMNRHLLAAIAANLARKGMFEQAKGVLAEAGMEEDLTGIALQEELAKVLDSLEADDVQNVNIGRALWWCKTNEDALKNAGSRVEFEICKFKFLQLVNSGEVSDAISFAREQLPRFADRHQIQEIQALVGSLVFTDAEAASEQLRIVKDHIVADGNLINGTSSSFPLEDALKAGEDTLQKLRKYYRVMLSRKPLSTNMSEDSARLSRNDDDGLIHRVLRVPSDVNNGDKANSESPRWVDMDQLPVHSSGDPEQIFHSSIICPVTKLETLFDNYAVALRCGHVIAVESMQRIEGSSRSRFRCPTCQTSQNISKSVRLYF